MNATWGNVLRGCAYGDAWAVPDEFRSYADLTRRNPRGPELPERLIITDDTQMTLSLARALDGAAEKTDDQLRDDVIKEFVLWLNDPDNDRAPGNTCLAATRKLASGLTWPQATVPGSDGCGTVMRVSPAAFLAEGRWQPVAAWQAATTHGKASGIAASMLTAAIIRRAAQGDIASGQATKAALDLPNDPKIRTCVGDWLAGHPLAETSDAIDALLDGGFTTVRGCLQNAHAAVDKFRSDPWASDPCAAAGEGWRAQETLATALLCIDALPGEPIDALRRATVTNGDSDSIAAVAGAILGAMHQDPWPQEWAGRLEPRYRDWIAEAEQYDFDGGRS
jgi:ADP-ribosylglycohydrolase